MKYLLLFLLPLLLSSCGPDPATIEGNLAAVVRCGQRLDADGAFGLFNVSSQTYLTRLAEIATGGGDELAAVSLGQHYGFPITTLIIYEQVRRLAESDSMPRKDITPQLIVFGFMLGEMGVFSQVEDKPIEIYAEPRLYGPEAVLSVKVPNGTTNSSFIANYAFYREEGRWKLDYLSTFGVLEKALAQRMRQSDLLPYDFAKQHLDGGKAEFEFQYRR